MEILTANISAIDDNNLNAPVSDGDGNIKKKLHISTVLSNWNC
jgi:hypothetical protein